MVTIDGEDAKDLDDAVSLTKENGIYLEISARSGHCLGNGHVANIASEVGNKLLVNTALDDTGHPGVHEID